MKKAKIIFFRVTYLGKCFLIVDFLKPKIEVAAIEFLVRGSFTEFS